jgi:hypothetical protein
VVSKELTENSPVGRAAARLGVAGIENFCRCCQTVRRCTRLTRRAVKRLEAGTKSAVQADTLVKAVK